MPNKVEPKQIINLNPGSPPHMSNGKQGGTWDEVSLAVIDKLYTHPILVKSFPWATRNVVTNLLVSYRPKRCVQHTIKT